MRPADLTSRDGLVTAWLWQHEVPGLVAAWSVFVGDMRHSKWFISLLDLEAVRELATYEGAKYAVVFSEILGTFDPASSAIETKVRRASVFQFHGVSPECARVMLDDAVVAITTGPMRPRPDWFPVWRRYFASSAVRNLIVH